MYTKRVGDLKSANISTKAPSKKPIENTSVKAKAKI
jgi:hypothetical protein